jgi:hypothetical protein
MSCNPRVFLDDTSLSGVWQDEIKLLLHKSNLGWFDPCIIDCTSESLKRKHHERRSCDFCLYCITPDISGLRSIAEAVNDSNHQPDKTVVIFLRDDIDPAHSFTEAAWHSLQAIGRLLERNGAKVCLTLEEAVDYLSASSLFNQIASHRSHRRVNNRSA